MYSEASRGLLSIRISFDEFQRMQTGCVGIGGARRRYRVSLTGELTRCRRLVQEARRQTGGGAMQPARRDNCYAPQVATAWPAPPTRAEPSASRRFVLFAPVATNRIPRAGQAA